LFDLIIFDLDGTLVDSKEDIALSVNLTLDEFGVQRRDPELIYTYIGGGVHNLIRRSLTDEYAHLLDRGVDIFWENYKGHVLDTTKPFPGVYRMLEGLSGRKMAVVTNKPYTHTTMVLRGLDLDRYFISVQGWKVGLPVKPDPALVKMALDETGVSPGRAVMIGDGVSDVLAARGAGTKSCAVGYGYGSKEKLLEEITDIVGILG
jgi:phosphoglycolate phosphatase